MYEQFFSLSRRPFTARPEPASYYPAAAHRSVLALLKDCVEHVQGIGLLLGPSGVGKTLIGELLVRELRSSVRGLLLNSLFPNRRALLQAVLFELRQPYQGLEEQELRLSLLNFLTAPCGAAQLLLVVDEAHLLPQDVLEELRLLTNVQVEGRPAVRLVLIGQPALEDRLAVAALETLNQRIARRTYLGPLSARETAEYIDDHLRHAGAEAERIFTAEAIQTIHRASDGIPRAVNLLCDETLRVACTRHVRPVTAAIVREAWSELQHLPATWDLAPSSAATGSSIVEFAETTDNFDARLRACTAGGPSVPQAGAVKRRYGEREDRRAAAELELASPAAMAASGPDPILADIEAICSQIQSQAELTEPWMPLTTTIFPASESDGSEWSDAAAGRTLPEPARAQKRPLESRRSKETPLAAISPLDEAFDRQEEVRDQYAALDARRSERPSSVVTGETMTVPHAAHLPPHPFFDPSLWAVTATGPTTEAALPPRRRKTENTADNARAAADPRLGVAPQKPHRWLVPNNTG